MNRRYLVAGAFALLATASTPAHAADPAASVKEFMSAYDRAFNAKDLAQIAKFYDADVTIYEGGGINSGWADYRDNHLGPELKEFLELDFSHSNVVPHILDKDATLAYVTSEYHIKVKMKERDVDSGGLETLVLIKGSDGGWRIRHAHTSSRRRPAPAAAASPKT